MKKSTSLILAVVSTMFLTIGAARAAEKFDTLAKAVVTSEATLDEQMPTLPTQIDERSF